MPFKPSAKRLLFTSALFISIVSVAQTNEDTISSTTLKDVRITAFEQNRRLRDIPAPVGYVSHAALQRFSPASIVHAVNTVAGVRMEERSPGSYRFNIRGSSLRSPFGVRNVKVYFNDIPFTDPGGHTYLNQLGFYNFNSIEIIKGPGSSLYGAGTGGVLLIESLSNAEKPGIMTEYAAGSFGLQNIYGSFTSATENAITRVGYQHQQSEGYRNHSELKRDVLSWSGRFQLNDKRLLKTTFLYGDLFYETPGALTKAEYESDPQSSRPGGFGFPGAEVARASIRQRTFLAGASYEQDIFSWLKNKSVLYGMFTELRNPTIRNYGKSSEPHVGGRSTFKLHKDFQNLDLNIDLGTEWQQGFTSVDIHRNIQGHPDSLQTHDEINTRQASLFAQATVDIGNRLTLNAGASLNTFKIRFQRFIPRSLGMQERDIKNELAPRFAIMYKLNRVSVYSSISKGFSPPTSAELLPTGGAINLNLDPEDGMSYDVGVKGTLANNFSFDISAFLFNLNNTVVQRRDAGGGDFFVNAGKTDQKGIEATITYPLLRKSIAIENDFSWISYTYHHFRYDEFKQLANDFSGNKLPGVAPHTVSAGYDVLFRNGFLGTITYYYSDEMPLNDANSEYAESYHLLGLKAGYQKILANKFRLKIFAGVENLLDERYSLGNDINGFGGRYYNAAQERNYYAGLVFQWIR
jgi:iron complex outermembrane recepter protein